MSTVKKNVDDAAKRVKGPDQKVGERFLVEKQEQYIHSKRDSTLLGQCQDVIFIACVLQHTRTSVIAMHEKGFWSILWLHVQADKKAAEAARAKELAELFAVAIKQPKVPVGGHPLNFSFLTE